MWLRTQTLIRVPGSNMQIKNLRGFYQINDQEYRSVTNILKVISTGDGLLHWYGQHGFDGAQRLMKEAGERGSSVHQGIDMYLKGKIKDFDLLPLEIKVRCETIKKWIDTIKPKVIDTERIVWSDRYRYAGTLDTLCMIKNDYCIVDWKNTSGIYLTHFIQQAAYAKALKEREGIKVKRLIIVRPVINNENTENTVEVQERNDVVKLFRAFKSAQVLDMFMHPRSAMRIK